MKLVIDRSRWIRGKLNRGGPAVCWPPRVSQLRRRDGCMCCLGFLALIFGLSVHDITDMGTPKGCKVSRERWPDWIFQNLPWGGGYTDSIWVSAAIVINDDFDLDEEKRELKLVELFATNGIELSFVDSVEPT